MSIHYPNESAQYRSHRDKLLKAEISLKEQTERVAQLRRGLPLGGEVKENYLFDSHNGSKIALSNLFMSGKNNLALYSYMYGPENENPCAACTSFLDIFDRSAKHLKDIINVAVNIAGPIEKLESIARERDWSHFQLISSMNNSYNLDYHGESKKGQEPVMNIFSKRDGKIFHFWGSEMLFAETEGHPRHIDSIWPLWNLLDLTPEGRSSDWFPKL